MSDGKVGHRFRCIGPWPSCGHAEGVCTASPDYQAEINRARKEIVPMTDAMLTRMARAIHHKFIDDESWEQLDESDVSWWEVVAKAALEAIYEPSEDMLEVASRSGPDTNNGPFSYDDARTVWRDMTAAILQGEA